MKTFNLYAEESFRAGLKSYSIRNGWNGPLMNFDLDKKKDAFENLKKPEGIYEDELGLVTKVKNDYIQLINKKK